MRSLHSPRKFGIGMEQEPIQRCICFPSCVRAPFNGVSKAEMIRGPDGKEIPPTGKSVDVDFCIVARWDKGQVVEENLFYDLVKS